MKPLSIDTRLRVASALTDGETTRAVTRRFGLSVASVVRIGQLPRSGRELSPRRIGGSQPRAQRGKAGVVIERHMAAKADWTVRDLPSVLRADGIQVSHDTVWRFMRGKGLTFRKDADGQRDRPPKDCALSPPLEGASAPD